MNTRHTNQRANQPTISVGAAQTASANPAPSRAQAPSPPKHWGQRVVVLTLALVTLMALGFGGIRALDVADAWSDRFQNPAHRSAQATVPREPTDETRLLVFYDPSLTNCASCDLHTWRIALYARDFRAAGAEVLGVVGGLRNDSPQLDTGLELPWEIVLDRSGRLADYYGVNYGGPPTVIVVDGSGRVLFRDRPDSADDRLEADILTTLYAVREALPADDADPAIAHVR